MLQLHEDQRLHKAKIRAFFRASLTAMDWGIVEHVHVIKLRGKTLSSFARLSRDAATACANYCEPVLPGFSCV